MERELGANGAAQESGQQSLRVKGCGRSYYLMQIMLWWKALDLILWVTGKHLKVLEQSNRVYLETRLPRDTDFNML